MMLIGAWASMSAQGNAQDTGMTPYSQYTLPIDRLPKTAVLAEELGSKSVYIQTETGEEDVQIVWLTDKEKQTVTKVCQTFPGTEPQWQRMSQPDADGVSVGLASIAVAEKAYIAPGDGSKVIVEGCPDGRNEWTYVVDTKNHTAIQLPSTEGVVDINHDTSEITLGFYGYDDDGRYSYLKVYDANGKFLRQLPGKERY